MNNLDSILKSRDFTLLTKVHLVKAMVFPVVMYGCENWTIKKTEHQRIDAFELWVLEKTLESPLDYKEIQPVNPKGNQSWICNGRTGAETEAPILWPPDVKNSHCKRPWCWERLKAGGEGDNRGWDGWMASLARRTWVWASSGSWWWTEKPGVLQSLGSQRVRRDWATELNWMTTIIFKRYCQGNEDKPQIKVKALQRNIYMLMDLPENIQRALKPLH